MTSPAHSMAARESRRDDARAAGVADFSLPEPGFVPVSSMGTRPLRDRQTADRCATGTVLRRSVIRRILDKDGKKVDLDRIKKSSDVTELTFWLDGQEDWEEAPSEEETAAIKARLAELQPPTEGAKDKGKEEPPKPVEDPVAKAKAEAERKAREFQDQFETAAGKPLPNFDGATAKTLFEDVNVPKRDVGNFFLRCAALTLTPATVLAELTAITAENHSRLWGALAFADGASLADAKALTTLDLSCLNDVGEDFSIDALVGLIDRRVLTISKNTYRVTKGTGANGAIYRFEFPGRKQLGPIGAEWHVHFGVRDAPENPGFKHKTKGKESFRVETKQAGCAKLKKCFGPLWGVKT